MTTPDGTTLKGGASTSALHARPTLVFYHRDGAQVAQLEKGRPLIVGRTAPADVEIPDPGLSRQHARFTWDERGIWVEDLESTNGTKKNGEPITRAGVSAGDQIAIGPVMVAVHVIGGVASEELRAGSMASIGSARRSARRSRARARSRGRSRSSWCAATTRRTATSAGGRIACATTCAPSIGSACMGRRRS